MNRIRVLLLLVLTSAVAWGQTAKFVIYDVDPRVHEMRFYLKDGNGERIGNFERLRSLIESGKNKKLLFACNGGMFRPDFNPVGLYVEDFQTRSKLDTGVGQGNFYLQPNGVFYLSGNGKAAIQTTRKFRMDKSVRYATQSGPMLVIDSAINSVFQKGSENLNIRNGVGILPNGHALFVMSRVPVNFDELATFFCSAGCRMALYLDGYVSRTYLPEQGLGDRGGEFGVMIGVSDSVQAKKTR